MHQLGLLHRIRDGIHPLAGVVGRHRGAVVRNLETLRLRGFLWHRGESHCHLLTQRARVMIGA
jgi:hypothetical protein